MTQLAQAFKELGVKPKLKSAKELETWMIGYAYWTAPRTSQSEMLQEEGATSSPQQLTAITTHLAKLPMFSGDRKAETSYDLWRYEVECLMRDNVFNYSAKYQKVTMWECC